MNNFTKSSILLKSENRGQLDFKQINVFLSKAGKINNKSSSRDICNLISEIITYQHNNMSFFSDILMGLQYLLSDCIKSKCDYTDDGFINLKDYVEKKRKLLEELHFI